MHNPSHLKKNVRWPGIEPGAHAWEAYMLPLHYQRPWCNWIIGSCLFICKMPLQPLPLKFATQPQSLFPCPQSSCMGGGLIFGRTAPQNATVCLLEKEHEKMPCPLSFISRFPPQRMCTHFYLKWIKIDFSFCLHS